MDFTRSSGILLHPTSFPGKYGIGSMGAAAYRFIDFLILSGQKLWQIFPLGPTGYGDSPYQSFSAFAGNPLLIDLELLKDDGLLENDDLDTTVVFDDNTINYGEVINFKYSVLRKSFNNFLQVATTVEQVKLENFCKRNESWLENYALFMALKEHFHNKSWLEWDEPVKHRDYETLQELKKQLKDNIDFHKFLQYLFFNQWFKLKSYANQNGIQIIGDIPIFVALDSSDSWANTDIFSFNDNLEPIEVAGVPPDYFSKTGQLWGNPLYKWDRISDDNYKWWIHRIKNTLKLVDIIRIDHFRGFSAYWAIPYEQSTAVNGKWREGPGREFFVVLKQKLGNIPIIAEDLGMITPDVTELLQSLNLPGMKVLQFAFDSKEESEHLPHNYDKNSVVYTGTHDNNTTLGWYKELGIEDKTYLQKYLNLTDNNDTNYDHNICWELIRAAWSSVSVFALVPMQDVLCLGQEARMNTPGTSSGNWKWRYKENQLTSDLSERLKELTTVYQRKQGDGSLASL